MYVTNINNIIINNNINNGVMCLIIICIIINVCNVYVYNEW